MSVHATTQTPASSAQPAYDYGYDDDRGYGWVVFAGSRPAGRCQRL